MKWRKIRFTVWIFSGGLPMRFPVRLSGGGAPALLQTLKRLSDEKRIDWQPYKTPAQYINEVRMPVFRQLTNHFLRVRYGNFEVRRNCSIP